MMNHLLLSQLTALCCLLACAVAPFQALIAADATKPNVIFILTDDMGRGDIAALGGKQGATPHLDRLASEGTSFNRFYVASPICSASRTAFMTGSFPSRWRINSYLNSRAGNQAAEQSNFLDPKAPTVARALKESGYATAHFGKWHLGGGRDVQDAPLPQAYGFDESHVNCEGMGPRFEDFGKGQNPVLNTEDGKTYVRSDFTRYWVDRSLDFIKRHQQGPFYLELWPQDVHTPHTPSEEALRRTTAPGLAKDEQNFRGVLNEYDLQIGRFLAAIHELGLDENTVVIFSADNGPAPSFNHARTLDQRGMKWSLYEGGTHVPFFVRWTGHVPAGKINDSALLSSVDYLPTICALAGAKLPNQASFDGIDQSRVWLGNEAQPRAKPLFWEYGRNAKDYVYPKGPGKTAEVDKSPNVGVRDGDWKFLLNADGTQVELYNIVTDPKEANNVAKQYPEIVTRLSTLALAWRKSLP